MKSHIAKLLLVIFITLMIFRTADVQAQRGISPGVTLIGSQTCQDSFCFLLEVNCKGVPSRNISIRKTAVPGTSQGAIVFNTGGWGKAYFSDSGTERNEIWQYALDRGLDVYELKWLGPEGWATGGAGFGYRRLSCGFTEVVKWLNQTNINQENPVCTAGNSGGALQISYGLTFYNLEEQIDAAILTAGPPISQLSANCFGSYAEQFPKNDFSASGNGRYRTDLVHGILDDGFCQLGETIPQLENRFEEDSIVGINPLIPRDYNYPGVALTFINSKEDPTNANFIAWTYYNMITSEANWLLISGKEHEVDNTPNGAARIRNAIDNTCLA